MPSKARRTSARNAASGLEARGLFGKPFATTSSTRNSTSSGGPTWIRSASGRESPSRQKGECFAGWACTALAAHGLSPGGQGGCAACAAAAKASVTIAKVVVRAAAIARLVVRLGGRLALHAGFELRA